MFNILEVVMPHLSLTKIMVHTLIQASHKMPNEKYTRES